eukprot:CAMPEP_0206541448 /NCGR_PEP_ID=MMETSP0325_2-20121206/9613_1 /ASSEMBLY_ACC=CAM_ASM_000347 /TAXON_ID=2866 /ORGANISM="Crypthecodinium cohnii, Strain Seligo" /LENGTH=61 /DNA_ID=CAMNT_0054039377 /DNA_START=526 /DNA_END=711 /DNA_ORIENTATION=-
MAAESWRAASPWKGQILPPEQIGQKTPSMGSGASRSGDEVRKDIKEVEAEVAEVLVASSLQ